MSTFPPPQPQTFHPDNAAERAAAVERLKAAKKSMMTSVGFSVLLLAYLIWRISYVYSRPELRGNSTVLLVIGALILARLGWNGYRLFNKWKALQAAQDHHRSFN